MKIAVSIPDDLYQRAERHAHRVAKTRSRLYQEALAEYLLRRDSAEITSAIDDVLARIDEPRDPWSQEAAMQTLNRTEW